MEVTVLGSADAEYKAVSDMMQLPQVNFTGGLMRNWPLRSINVSSVFKIEHPERSACFQRKKLELGPEARSERLLHGSPAAFKIASEGFDVSLSADDNLFGPGVYLTPDPATANKYTFGKQQACPNHSQTHCVLCPRLMLVVDCLVGRKFVPSRPGEHAPSGYDSIVADPATNPQAAKFLESAEFVALSNNQLLPLYVVEYTVSVYSREDLAKLVSQQMMCMQPSRNFVPLGQLRPLQSSS